VGVIARWRDRLPVTAATPDLTLGEGATPLIAAPALSAQLGAQVFLKIEGANPTGSFKDRGMAVAMACAVGRGAKAVVCASTGNTAASAAAYAARAGIEALILHPAGAVSGAKLAQARIVGAAVVPIEGTFDDALRLAQEAAGHGYIVVNSGYNADRIAGQRTAVYEIIETLGSAPDVLALPYGGGGNTVAYRSGFEVEGVTPLIVSGEARERQTTIATAIRIGDPVHAPDVADTHAQVVTLDDAEILSAWSDLARLEGVFCEPSSAAGLAALRRQLPPAGATVVCVLTGSGLKDVDAVDSQIPPSAPCAARLDAVLEAAHVAGDERRS
jgi:threonine synthase